MRNKKILITGNSSGLGLGFTNYYLNQGSEVYGLSRRGCPINNNALFDIRCDVAKLDELSANLDKLLGNEGNLDLAILNAGILGDISDMQDTDVDFINNVMQINVWSNKMLLDHLIKKPIQCKQIVLISSGAAIRGNKGWGAYALSKATLNMLSQLYAAEMPNSHLCALAPGLVDTAMQDYLCDNNNADIKEFPSLQALRSARGTDAMPDPQKAAENIAAIIPKLMLEQSGSFVDVRNF